jgi:hypothetical protein
MSSVSCLFVVAEPYLDENILDRTPLSLLSNQESLNSPALSHYQFNGTVYPDYPNLNAEIQDMVRSPRWYFRSAIRLRNENDRVPHPSHWSLVYVVVTLIDGA